MKISKIVAASVALSLMTIAFPAMAGSEDSAPQAKAQSPVTGLLANASDSALDDLSQPGAFYADEAIRIGLPGAKGGLLQKGFSLGNKLGITSGITRSLNEAAGKAAGEAKPIFRAAINDLSVNDVPGLVTKSDGGTRYLKQSAGDELSVKIRPLIAKALGEVGAYDQLDKLGSKNSFMGGLGLTNDGLTDSVTKQALKGIFKYMGSEEKKLRKNPLKAGKKIFKIFK